MRKAVHTTPFLYDRFISEPFTKKDQWWNAESTGIYMYYAQTILELSRKVVITSQIAMPGLVTLASSFEKKLLNAYKEQCKIKWLQIIYSV